MSDSDDDDIICPLCIQSLDATDKAINYCACGFQMCLWCWHKLMETAHKDSLPGRCPNCRTIYDKEKIEMHAINPEMLEEERRKKKEERKKGKGGLPKSKHDLAHIRVVQRNLVYAVGLPLHICREETLAEKSYFGQFGKTKKISVNRNGLFAQGQGKSLATGSAYVTFARAEDAVRCIDTIDGTVWEGKPVRACFGTTKYCNAFLKGVTCNNPDCLYLHDIANEDDSFNKDDMNNGTLSKHIMQLVQPLAGERGKAAALAKAPFTPLPQAPTAESTAPAAEPPMMTPLGKTQAGPTHINPWLQHALHTPAAPEAPPSPVQGPPNPPGPNLAEQEWPSLHATVEDHDRDRTQAADDVKATTNSLTTATSTASSLSGDGTVADAVKAAIAAATAPKPTIKPAAPGKHAAQTITLTKPAKAKVPTVVAAAKAKTQVQTAIPAPSEPSTSSTATTIPTTAAAAVASTTAPRESRVAAAVEAALQPPSPAPSYQQAASGTLVATKPAVKAGLANGKVHTSGSTASFAVMDGDGGDGLSLPAASTNEEVASETTDSSQQETAVAPSWPELRSSAHHTPPHSEPFLSAATSSTDAHPLSHTSSMSSDLSAVAAEARVAESAAEASAQHNGQPVHTEAQVVSEGRLASLISSSDPPVSPPSNIITNMSSASLAGWLGTGGESTATSTPTANNPATSAAAIPIALNPMLDPPVAIASMKPAVPPGFGVPTAGSTILKQPSLGTRGPPPGFSQPWGGAAVPPVATPAAPPATSFDVDMFFTVPAADPVADAAATGRRQSRFRFAQNGSMGPAESQPAHAPSDLHMLGLPGVDERRPQEMSEELSLFRKIFPTAKLNIMPGTSPPQHHLQGSDPHASAAPWPMAASQPVPPGPAHPPLFPMLQHHEPTANGSPSAHNPGFNLLQQLQRAARTDPAASNAMHAPSIPQPIASGNPYAPSIQASQPPPPSFLDPAIINAHAKAAPDMGPSPPTHPAAWPPGFGSAGMQYTPPPASLHIPGMANGSQPMMFAQQQQQQQAQHAAMMGDPAMFGFLRQPQPSLTAQQQQQGYPSNVPAVRAQQRGPPPGFNPGTASSFNSAYPDYSNAYNNLLQQTRVTQQANPHLYGVADHYQAANSHLPNGADVNKGYLFPTRI